MPTCTRIIVAALLLPVALPAQDVADRWRKFAPDSFWVSVWTRGYTREPDLLVEPRGMAITPGALVVLDEGTREVLSFDLRTGATRARLVARRGSGPGEFRRPFAVVTVPGGFAVSDQGNSRLSAFTSSGRLMWDMHLPNPVIEAICVDQQMRVVFHTKGRTVESRDTTGRLRATRQLPWTTSPNESLTDAVVVSGPTQAGSCVMARAFGSQWAVVPSVGRIRAHPFIEPGRAPRVATAKRDLGQVDDAPVTERLEKTESTTMAQNAMVYGDTLIVRFGGNTAARIRLLDYYHIPTGRYLYSRKLQSPFVTMTIGPDGTFYGAHIRNEDAGVIAFRPSATKSSTARE